MALNKATFLKLKPKSIEKNVLGEKVLLRPWSGIERQIFMDANEKEMSAGEKNTYLNGLIIALSLVDDDTKELMFNIDEIHQIKALESKFVDELVKASMDINGLSESSREDAEKK